MELTITAKIQILPTHEQTQLLHTTLSAVQQGA